MDLRACGLSGPILTEASLNVQVTFTVPDLVSKKMSIMRRNKNRNMKTVRKLHLENLEIRQTMNADFDDQISEARSIRLQGDIPVSISGVIDNSRDVAMVSFNATAGQIIDFDIDTPQNGPGGLGAHIRIFNSQGVQISANNDAAAPGESLGFDSFLRHRFSQGGTYHVGVSNWLNTNYNPVSGNNDAWSWQHAVGSYTLILNTTPVGSFSTPNSASAPTASSIATLPTSVETRAIVEDTPMTQAVTVVATSAPQDWSIPVSSQSNPNTPEASRDDWFASLGRSVSDPMRRFSLSI